jgi:hypothetical protein
MRARIVKGRMMAALKQRAVAGPLRPGLAQDTAFSLSLTPGGAEPTFPWTMQLRMAAQRWLSRE